MAQSILTVFVYILAFIFAVTVATTCSALLQLLKDQPPIRRRIWDIKARKTTRLDHAGH